MALRADLFFRVLRVQYIFDELAVHFGNGMVKVDPRYHAQLLTLAEKASTMDGDVIEVKGYASSAGVSLNQKRDRANNVTKVVV